MGDVPTIDATTINPLWWIVAGVLVVLLVGLLVWVTRRNAQRTELLKDRFKSEYDRTASSSSKKATELDLERRTERRSRVHLADLEESDAESLQQHEDELLRSFVDGPQGAALGMTQLLARVAGARGYVATEGSVLDLVSVDHPEQVAVMRRSEAEMESAKGSDLTEASRQTFLAARALAERLLAEGRAGHVEQDVPEPQASAPPGSSSDRVADAPAPSSSHVDPSPSAIDRDPSAPARSRSTEAGPAAAPSTTDTSPAGLTGDGTPRRR